MRQPTLPDFIDAEAVPGGAVYRWAVLPPHPGPIAFFVVLTAGFLLLGPTLMALGVTLHEPGDTDTAGLTVFGSLWTLASLFTVRWFAVILLGRCRLRLDAEGLDYEISILGRRLEADSRHVPAGRLVALRIREAAQGGIEVAAVGDRPFYLKLPVGTGALSMAELLRLRDRWLADLGRAPRTA